MKRIIAVLATLLFLLLSAGVSADTLYYQPTPFPLKKSDGSAMPQDLDKVHVMNGNLYYCSWCNSGAGITYFGQSDRLQTGGWGDRYDPFIKFDLTGLPTDSTYSVMWFMPFTLGGGTTTTPFAFCTNDGAWDLTMLWSTQPARTCWGYYADPTSGSWWGFDITSIYNGWKAGTQFSGGVSMFPQNTSNNFDVFRNTSYADYANDPSADGKRPILQLTFTPTLYLKVPLPAGYTWLLTNEIGGYECSGASPWPDTAHQGSNYFSLDFTSSGSGYPTGVPILAAASGQVAEVGFNSSNGNYIAINHGSFQTRYLHLASAAARKNGSAFVVNDTVTQGDQLGIMGNTGASTGTHLHFGVRYQGSGAATVSQLTKVVMDGLLLKSYQTECSVNGSGVPTGWIRRYGSSLTPTGY